MVPPDEVDRLVLTVSEAFSCGAEERLPRGYLLLKEGLRAARESGEPWAAEAAELWRQALVAYQQRFPAEWYPPLP